jgi:hypothetical protein
MAKKSTGRRITDRAEAAELIDAWVSSGECMSDWCRKRGINWYSMNAYWGRGGVRPSSAFVELAVAPPDMVAPPVIPEPATEAWYRICLGSDLAIEVDDHFRDDTLRRLIRVAASC